MAKFIDLTGQRFGRLVAIERKGVNSSGHITWLCRCDCGSEAVIASDSLICGRTKSCSCLNNEILKKNATTHGQYNSRLYAVWINMKGRCYNHNNNRYYRYGSRSITVCDEWRNDFAKFYEWAMANGYDENAPRGQCTIDRIDNDKGYSPDNCRWVDMKTQRNNRSDSRKENRNERYQAN